MTAAYMKILIHAVNGSLFPDANPDSITWTGPPIGIVFAQSLLYASLATSLLAAFFAMFGKQWISWYLRCHEGTAADKSRDRQLKSDGLHNWYFHIVIEGLPVMLQLVLVLLGFALPLRLWNVNRAIAGMITAGAVLGGTSYTCLTIVAILYDNCPYQTVVSIIIRSLVSRPHATRTPPPAPLVDTPKRPVKELRRILRRLHSGIWSALYNWGRTGSISPETPDIPLAAVALPTRIFEDILLDWESYKVDARCVAWVLYYTTDNDTIFSTVRFAADLTWYPEIADILPPRILADLFYDCLLDRRVVPGRAEQASLVGMTLASILSVRLSVKPESEDFNQLCQRIAHSVDLTSLREPTFTLVASILNFVAQTPLTTVDGGPLGIGVSALPKHLPVTFKLWVGRMILQTVWRWRRLPHPTTTIDFYWIASTCKNLVAEGDHIPTVFKTIWILTLTVYTGAEVDIRDLFPPDHECAAFPLQNLCIVSPINRDALYIALNFLRGRLIAIIQAGNVQSGLINSTFSTLSDLDVSRVANFQGTCISWVHEIVNSGYPEGERYSMASSAVALLGKRFDSPSTEPSPLTSEIRPLLDYLLLSENFPTAEFQSHPGVFALRLISTAPGYRHLQPAILPVLTSTLLQSHPLQSRSLALKIFQRPGLEWCSPQAEGFLDTERARLLEAVGDPFQFTPDLPPQNGQPTTATDYEPMRTAVLLIKFASSDLWRDHLRPSNFTSCEEMISTEEGRDLAFECLDEVEMGDRSGLDLVIGRLEALECRNTVEAITLWARTNGIMKAAKDDIWPSKSTFQNTRILDAFEANN
jgi:hypothetical protein